jgi:hypothetical protein
MAPQSFLDIIRGLGAILERNMARQAFKAHHATEHARFAKLIQEIDLEVE